MGKHREIYMIMNGRVYDSAAEREKINLGMAKFMEDLAKVYKPPFVPDLKIYKNPYTKQ